MSKITLRNARQSDVDAIHFLLKQLAVFLNEENRYKNTPEVLRKIGFGNTPLFHASLAFSSVNPVGLCLYFSEFSTWRGQAGLYIQDLFVASEMRGSGLGKGLVNAALAAAKNNWDARYVRLAVDAKNHSAIDFYHSLGFAFEHNNRTMIMDT